MQQPEGDVRKLLDVVQSDMLRNLANMTNPCVLLAADAFSPAIPVVQYGRAVPDRLPRWSKNMARPAMYLASFNCVSTPRRNGCCCTCAHHKNAECNGQFTGLLS